MSTITFPARTSYVKIPLWGQQSSNHGMPFLLNIFGPFLGKWNQPNKNRALLFRCLADMVSNITNCEIQRPGMLIAQKINQGSLLQCTHKWKNAHPGRKLMFYIAPPIGLVHLGVYSEEFQVSEAHHIQIVVRLKW
jgi:hypothetical protein